MHLKWFRRQKSADLRKLTRSQWEDIKGIYKGAGWLALEQYLENRRYQYSQDIVSLWASMKLNRASQEEAAAKTIGIVSRIMESSDVMSDLDDRFNEPEEEERVFKVKTISEYV